jgi:hypothetical protein
MSRELLEVSDETWDRLPKDVRGNPVFFRRTEAGIELWPQWAAVFLEDQYFSPKVWVEP